MGCEITSKERINAVLTGKSFDRTPITPIVMAWAANYIGRSYRDYYLNAEVLAKAQIAVARDFGFDQVSAISDPWREASGYGMQFDYPPDTVGRPKFELLRTEDDFSLLKIISINDIPRMLDRLKAVQLMADSVGGELSVLGWIEGPFAEYADLRGVQNALMDTIERPSRFLDSAQVILQNAINFSIAQIRAGADTIGVGDAAVSLLSPDMYDTLIFQFHQKLFDAIHDAGAKVKLHICGNISSLLPMLTITGVDIIDVDWMVSFEDARKNIGDTAVLCGNIDPVAIMLNESEEVVLRKAQECIMSAGAKFILMPGCEVPLGTPEHNMKALVKAVMNV